MDTTVLALIGITVIIAILLTSLQTLTRDRHYKYKAIHKLLTPAELDFYHQLIKLIPQYAVMCKVRLADVLEPNEYGRRQRYAFNRIRSKHLDFVVIDPATSDIKFAIELDDSSHNLRHRIERDNFVNEIAEMSELKILRHKLGEPLTPKSLPS